MLEVLRRRAEVHGFTPSFSISDSLFKSRISISKLSNVFTIIVHCNKTYIFQILSKIVETFFGYVPNNDQEYVRDQ